MLVYTCCRGLSEVCTGVSVDMRSTRCGCRLFGERDRAGGSCDDET
jgi:hypothetical protein